VNRDDLFWVFVVVVVTGMTVVWAPVYLGAAGWLGGAT
jgi:hypothetical protein